MKQRPKEGSYTEQLSGRQDKHSLIFVVAFYLHLILDRSSHAFETAKH